MENFEYSKSFPFADENDDASAADEFERIKAFLRNRQEEARHIPRFIIPGAPAIFEEMTAAWELVAKESGGRLGAKIDYTSYDATIEVWCDEVEFYSDIFMGILRGTTKASLSISFEPLASGELHIEIRMPYFTQALE